MDIKYLDLQRITAMHGDEIRHAIGEVVDSGRYLQGERVESFEKEYASLLHTDFCMSCASGLDALKLIIMGFKELGRLKDGDEIIVPANTYIASILAISECGLVPVLVEPDFTTLQINDDIISEHITSRTKAIMIVHLYGYNAMTENIARLCEGLNLLLIEDYAQAHGLPRMSEKWDNTIVSAQAHSFYPGKNLGALADAGAVTTCSKELCEVVKALRNYGSSEKYVFKYRGVNSRMDELSAAVLGVKLKYLHEDNARRQHIAERYINEIDNEKLILPSAEGVHHIFPILTPWRDELKNYLAVNGIETIIHYPIPPHKQECYREWNELSLHITQLIHSYELSIPLNQAMTDEEVTYVINALNNFEKH